MAEIRVLLPCPRVASPISQEAQTSAPDASSQASLHGHPVWLFQCPTAQFRLPVFSTSLSFPLAGVCLRPSILLGGWYLEAGEANISYQQIAAADGVWAEDK